MKNILVLIGLLSSSYTFAQVRKPTPIPPPPKPAKVSEQKSEKCFLYTTEERKDALVYVTENLLEYGWAGSNARMIITTFNYDPLKKEKVEKEGYVYAQSKSMQFINGSYKIEKDILSFSPEKPDKFKQRRFKIYYKAKTKNEAYLEDEAKHPFKPGKCLEPMVSM